MRPSRRRPAGRRSARWPRRPPPPAASAASTTSPGSRRHHGGRRRHDPLPTAVYSKTSDWGSGFEAQYVLTNPMSVPLNTWSLQFSLPSTEKITSMWGGTDTASGTTQKVVAQSYDTTIAAGASITIGFDASYSGTYAGPVRLPAQLRPL